MLSNLGRSVIKVVCLAVVGWVASHSVQAQTVAIAEVSGTVKDASGAVIPGAPVVMTETDKQLNHTATTDASGYYVLPNLPVGPYTLEVRVAGFKSYVQSGIVLIVGNNVEINVTLEVGTLNEKIEVQATAAMVETKENSVSAVVDEQRINELPLNGRQATQLILTLGGAAYADSGDTGSKTFYSATRISVAGGQRKRDRVPAGRRRQYRCHVERQYAVPVPGCFTGIQRGYQRCLFAVRNTPRCDGERNYEIRIEFFPWRSIRVHT
jgi:Carboxypeptidase regulatory-like domain